MLCKRLSRFHPPLAFRRRCYSAQTTSPTSPYPFHNLRAFPFKLSPDQAQRQLSPFASLIRHENMFSSVLSWILPALGFQPLKPAQFAAVYFPGWILDLELKGEVVFEGDDRQAFAQIHNAYVPGSDYKVISSAPIAPFDPHLRDTLPFSQDLQRQYDTDITCIPYNISPFPILDIAHQLSYNEAKITKDFRFTPSTIKPTLFAAYPVLIPLYLAQYEYETDTGTKCHTLFLEAYGSEGNIWSEPFGKHHAAENFIVQKTRSVLGISESINTVITNLGYPKKFVDTVGFSLTPHQELGLNLHGYLENALIQPSTATTLAVASVDDMKNLAEDKRVREFTHEERTPIIEWLKLGSELMLAGRMHDAIVQGREGITIKWDGPEPSVGQQRVIDDVIEHLVDRSKSLEAERRQVKPEWARTGEDLEEVAAEPKEPKPEA